MRRQLRRRARLHRIARLVCFKRRDRLRLPVFENLEVRRLQIGHRSPLVPHHHIHQNQIGAGMERHCRPARRRLRRTLVGGRLLRLRLSQR